MGALVNLAKKGKGTVSPRYKEDRVIRIIGEILKIFINYARATTLYPSLQRPLDSVAPISPKIFIW